MKVAIMQPYFFPYIGYFQLMNAVDTFVVYDNIQFTKKGWVRRNRMLLNGRDVLFSLSLKNSSDFLDIRDKQLATDYLSKNKKILRRFENAYSKAPNFHEVFPLIERCFLYEQHNNLFDFLLFSLQEVRVFLGIKSTLIVSSKIEGDNNQLNGKDRVLNLCESLKASIYINPIGGKHLYNKSEFEAHNVLLKFLQMKNFSYHQQGVINFIPNLSIIDVMMFHKVNEIRSFLSYYELF